MVTPVETVLALLSDPTNPDVVAALVAEDAKYVSLNFDTPDLKRIMPWAGSHDEPGALLQTFVDVNRYWTNEAFELTDVFGEGENVAAFGSFTYRSNTLGKRVTSAVAILAKVRDGQVHYMQFMEDTFATARSFRSGGTWTIQADPDGTTIEV
jgi:ketosteroid isomerase-like protein